MDVQENNGCYVLWKENTVYKPDGDLRFRVSGQDKNETVICLISTQDGSKEEILLPNSDGSYCFKNRNTGQICSIRFYSEDGEDFSREYRVCSGKKRKIHTILSGILPQLI